MIKIFTFIAVVLMLNSCNNTGSMQKNNAKKEFRIVSLVPSVTKELVALNLEQNIVGATSYCIVSATNKSLIVGTVTEVNIEKILLLKPDIVFASDLTKHNDITTLKNNNIKVHMLKKMHSYNDICNHFIDVGKVVGKANLAQNIVNKSNNKIDSLISTIPESNDSLTVFFQIGAKPIFSVLSNTFMNDYITMAKCKNIAYDLKRGTITRESVLHRNPDIIIVTTMGIVGDNEKSTWEGYSDLNAAINSKIFVIDANIASTPTVMSFTTTLEQVINYIYK